MPMAGLRATVRKDFFRHELSQGILPIVEHWAGRPSRAARLKSDLTEI